MKPFYLIVVAVIVAGCNMFSLIDAPYPETRKQTISEDPFNLSQILAGSGEQLKTDNYEELFSDNMEFESSAFSVVYRKERFLEVLERLSLATFHVEWSGGEIRDRGDVLVLSGVEYRVYFDGMVHYSGEAEFRILKGLNWNVEYWKDIPDDESNPFIN